MTKQLTTWYRQLSVPLSPTSRLWHYGLIAVIAVYLVTALLQSILLPIFEGPDEQRHYAYARYIVNNHALPPIYKDPHDNSSTYQVAQESGQPPLYYLLVALFTAPFPAADQVTAYVQVNPFMTAYDALGIRDDNHNRYLHGPERYAPFEGLSLAVHAGRLVSVLFGLVTLLAVYGAARAVRPAHPGTALLATALTACQPVFVFLSSAITNDAAVICFSALSTWIALRVAREGPTFKLAVLGGLFAGLTAMSKFNGVWLCAVVGLAIIASQIIGARRNPAKPFNLWPVLAAAAVFVLTVGWWYARNAIVYGDPFGLMIHAIGDESPLRLGKSAFVDFNFRLNDLETSAWYSSGWAALIPGPEWLYTTWRLLFGVGWLGAAGVALQMLTSQRDLRNEQRNASASIAVVQALCMLLCLALALAGGLYWILVYMWSIGRLLFPALASAAVLAAVGWAWWFGRLRTLRAPYAACWLAAGLLAIALLRGSLGGILTTTEALNRHPDISEMTPQMPKTQLTFLDPGDKHTPVASVVGYEFVPQDLRSGGIAYGKICWKSEGYTAHNFPYSVQLVGDGDVRPATRSSYHGLGSYPLTAWKPGEIFCDVTSLAITGEVDRPRAYNVLVSVFQFVTNTQQMAQPLPVVDANGKEVYPVITRLRVAPRLDARAPATAKPAPSALIGDFAGLLDTQIVTQTQPDAGMALSVTLRWVARQSTPIDAKVFMHVMDSSGKVIAQSDHQPDDGWFPTNDWQAGDIILDQFMVQLPANAQTSGLALGLGMYDAQSIARLPAFDTATGQRAQDDMLLIRSK